jgi:hypothetical protein
MADPVATTSGNGSTPAAPPTDQPVSRPSTQEPGGQVTTPAFTPDQIRSWADSPVTAAPPQPPPVQYTPDQIRQWVTSGTGPLETSEALGKPAIPAPLSWLFPETWNNAGRIIGQQGIRIGLDTVAGFLGAGSAAGAGYAQAAGFPQSMFAGRSVQDVQAERDRLQADLQKQSAEIDKRAETGQLDGTEIMGAAAYEAGIHNRIAAADQYIAAGGKVQENIVSQGFNAFSRQLQTAQSAVGEAAKTLPQAVVGEVPVQFAQSPLGVGTAIAAQVAATAPLMAVDPAVATTIFGSQGFQGLWQDAKEHGADDRTAAISGLIGASMAPLQAAMVEVPSRTAMQGLAAMLAGKSWKAGIAELTMSAARGGVIQGGTQFLQNVTARLQGYDPNRPLDQGVWQQAIVGSSVDTIASVTTQLARRAGQTPAQPASQTEARTKPVGEPAAPPGAPPAPQTEADIVSEFERNINNIFPEPAPAAVTPQAPPEPAPAVPGAAVAPGAPTTQAPPPTEPLAEAQAALAASTGTPEQVLAAVGTPEQALARQTEAFGQPGVTGAPEAAPVVPQLSPQQEIIARGAETPVPRAEAAPAAPETPARA